MMLMLMMFGKLAISPMFHPPNPQQQQLASDGGGGGGGDCVGPTDNRALLFMNVSDNKLIKLINLFGKLN